MAITGAKKIRVLVADDSAFMCKVLRDLINADSQLEVIGQAHDGREAIILAESLRPDVITMDIDMPHVDGLQAIETIMSQHPRPIVVVSSEPRGESGKTERALQLGAIDIVSKPSGAVDLDLDTIRHELTKKLKLAAKVHVIRTASRATDRPYRSATGRAGLGPRTAESTQRVPIVVIAASTGGPAAVTQVVAGLPADLYAAVLLVLHMPVAFTKQFLEQLAEVASLSVKEPEKNETLKAGTIYLCPGSRHLRVSGTGNVSCVDHGPLAEGYRYTPSADLAFESVADYARSLATAVILTGMGNDGTQGAKAIRECGGYVIAQDEQTSTIFGMPGEAIKAGFVDAVLPLPAISAAIVEHVMKVRQLVPAGLR